jgi:hypothetical protein
MQESVSTHLSTLVVDIFERAQQIGNAAKAKAETGCSRPSTIGVLLLEARGLSASLRSAQTEDNLLGCIAGLIADICQGTLSAAGAIDWSRTTAK